MCLAKGHHTVMPLRLKPATPQSPDKHSTTEPLHSLSAAYIQTHLRLLLSMEANTINQREQSDLVSYCLQYRFQSV